MSSSTTHKWIEVPFRAIDASSKLLAEAEYADISLAFEGDLFRAHRAVVCPRSPIFKAECDGAFTEASTGRINIGAPSATLGSITRMLLYLYNHDYSDTAAITRELDTRGKPAVILTQAPATSNTASTEITTKQRALSLSSTAPDWASTAVDSQANTASQYNDPTSIPLRNVHVYGLADYYQIPDLKDAAKRKFTEALIDCEDASELRDIITQVYEYTFSKDSLRDIVTGHAAALRHRLNNDTVFLSGVSMIPDFMQDYLKATTQSYENEIAEQTTRMMKERDRVVQQLSAEKAKSTNLRLQVSNHQAVIGSLNKRMGGLSRICQMFNDKILCPSCQSSSLQMMKPKLKRSSSSPRTDEEAWFLQCTACQRKVSNTEAVTRPATTASPH